MTKRGGFSIVELILVIVLTGILSSVIVPIIITAVNSFQYDQIRNNLVSQARLSFDRLALEFRLISGPSAILAAEPERFRFIDTGSEAAVAQRTVEVGVVVDPNFGKILRYTRGSNMGVLSSFVENFNFAYLDDNGRILPDTSTPNGRSEIRTVRLDASWRPGEGMPFNIPYALKSEIMSLNLLNEDKLLP